MEHEADHNIIQCTFFLLGSSNTDRMKIMGVTPLIFGNYIAIQVWHILMYECNSISKDNFPVTRLVCDLNAHSTFIFQDNPCVLIYTFPICVQVVVLG